MIRRLLRVPIHPLAMSLYPVASLVAANLGQVKPTLGLRAGVLSAGMALLLTLGMRLISRDWHQAAVISTCGLLLFYSYGHVYGSLRVAEGFGEGLGRHRYLVPAFSVLAVGAYWLVHRSSAISASTTTYMNLAGILLLGVPLVQVFLAPSLSGGGLVDHMGLEADELDHSAQDPLPDVYYIVLDAYARGDTLRATYDYDNEPFLDQLRSLGFYVAECSQSNYAQTELSMASTLNAGYLDDLIIDTEFDRSDLWPLIRNSQVRRLFEELGYSSVAAETGYYWSEWEDADQFLAPVRGWLAGMSALEGTLLRSTAAWAMIDALPVLPPFLSADLDRSTDVHRERVEFVLDMLGEMAIESGPKFVFIHLVSPHRPFVFDALGNPIDDDYTWTQSDLGMDQYRLGYRGQVEYLNRRLAQIIPVILDHSTTEPVIIFQGDHGPEEGSSQDRMRILNAYYLPNGEYDQLYSTITPVNSFRVVINALFDAELPLLPDVSYFSTYIHPFDYSIVESDCGA